MLSVQAVPKETLQSKGPMAGVRYTGGEGAALSALRTHHLPARAVPCIEKITAKALPANQSTLSKFYILLFQETG